MYKTVSDIVSRYDSNEIVELSKRVDCYTWCYPLALDEFDVGGIFKENKDLLFKPQNITLYVHIPYCKFICSMCPFTHVVSDEKEIDIYVEAVIKEIEYYASKHIGNEFDVTSLYFGGGTASLLSPKHIYNILSSIRKYYNISDECQITLECHPNTVDKDYLFSIKSSGINRISFGIQSFNQKYLDSLKLKQNRERNIRVIEMAQLVGFNTVAADIMYNFPEESISSLHDDLDLAISLGLNNISLYSIDPQVRGLEINQATIDKEEDMFHYIFSVLSAANYQ